MAKVDYSSPNLLSKMLISEFALKIDIFYNQYHYFLYYIIYAYICSNNSASAESVLKEYPL